MTEAAIKSVAEVFHRKMRWLLTSFELRSIDEQNRSEGFPSDCCASHDHIDANMVMAPAFEEVMGHEVDSESEVDADIWNKAWDLVKLNGFSEEWNHGEH